MPKKSIKFSRKNRSKLKSIIKLYQIFKKYQKIFLDGLKSLIKYIFQIISVCTIVCSLGLAHLEPST